MKADIATAQLQGTTPIAELLRSKALSLAVGVLLGGLWAYFGYRHLVAFQMHGLWAHLLYGMVETLIALFFVTRSTPRSVSTNPFDWIIAFVGSFAPSFYMPLAWGIVPSADKVMYVGLALQIVGLISLNRSFAIVPAKREIKTRGMYRVVRHPLYAAYMLSMTGYVLANTNLTNLIVYLVAVGALLIRIVREEKHLALDPLYRKYMERVPYRLLPFVY